MKNIPLIITSLLIFILTGCSSSKGVSYGDPQKVETLTIEFGSTDLNTVAETMAFSLGQSSVIANAPTPQIVTLAEIKNKTREYIDTRAITAKIRTALTKTGRVKFAVSIDEMSSQTDELERQNQSGLYSESSVNQLGGMEAAKFRLEGSVTSIVKQTKDVKDVYYLFNLTLVDNQTGLVEWADEKEIRKVENR